MAGPNGGDGADTADDGTLNDAAGDPCSGLFRLASTAGLRWRNLGLVLIARAWDDAVQIDQRSGCHWPPCAS